MASPVTNIPLSTRKVPGSQQKKNYQKKEENVSIVSSEKKGESIAEAVESKGTAPSAVVDALKIPKTKLKATGARRKTQKRVTDASSTAHHERYEPIGFKRMCSINPVFTYRPRTRSPSPEFIPKYARTDEEVRREVRMKMGLTD